MGNIGDIRVTDRGGLQGSFVSLVLPALGLQLEPKCLGSFPRPFQPSMLTFRTGFSFGFGSVLSLGLACLRRLDQLFLGILSRLLGLFNKLRRLCLQSTGSLQDGFHLF